MEANEKKALVIEAAKLTPEQVQLVQAVKDAITAAREGGVWFELDDEDYQVMAYNGSKIDDVQCDEFGAYDPDEDDGYVELNASDFYAEAVTAMDVNLAPSRGSVYVKLSE